MAMSTSGKIKMNFSNGEGFTATKNSEMLYEFKQDTSAALSNSVDPQSQVENVDALDEGDQEEQNNNWTSVTYHCSLIMEK